MYILIGFRPFLRSSLGPSFHGPFSILTLIVPVPRCPPVSTAGDHPFVLTNEIRFDSFHRHQWEFEFLLVTCKLWIFHRKFVRACSELFNDSSFLTFRFKCSLIQNETVETVNFIYSLAGGIKIRSILDNTKIINAMFGSRKLKCRR